MLTKTFAAAILFVCLLSGNVLAHHAPGLTGSSHAGPLLTNSASTLQKGRFAMTFQSSYVHIDSFSNADMLGFAEEGHDVHTLDYLYTVSAGLAYGITDNLTVSLKIPYISFNNIREVHGEEHDEENGGELGEVHLHGDSHGIGDITVLGQYRFLKEDSRKLESSVLFGLKVPTGKTSKKDVNGERFETEFQPGSGSWDPILGLAVTKRFDRFSLDADARYTLVTEGAQDTDLGDLFNYDLALSYHLPARVPMDLVLELNGEWKQKQKINGEKDESSGEHALFLSPGMRINLGRLSSAFLSVGFPVVQDLNGIQSDTDYRVFFGVSIGL
jgi:hypothetical protein